MAMQIIGAKTAAQRVKSLIRDKKALALTEFAMSLPIFFAVSMAGIETADIAVTNMYVNQAALSLADNASRMGADRSALGTRQIYESDVNSVFKGVELQAAKLNLTTNSRIILSSLEVNDDGGQWIHWQRCMGELDEDSKFGVQGDGETGNEFAGMGDEGNPVKAVPDNAVMFVEIYYEFTPLFGGMFMPERTIYQTAAFNIRDDRTLSTGVLNKTPAATVASCA